MCGRYALHKDHPVLKAAFDIKGGPDDIDWAQLTPRYNIAPTSQVLTVVSKDGERRPEMMRWGLIPFWAKSLANGKSPVDAKGKPVKTPFNARAETIETTRSFSDAFSRRRCLVLADGFYEWTSRNGERRPLFIGLKSGEPFAMAGIWGSWGAAGETSVLSCTIITTSPNSFIERIHNRMPVILTKGAESIWLDNSLEDMTELKEVLVPYPAGEMAGYEVSSAVNSVKNDGPQCIQPQTDPVPYQASLT